MAAMTEQQQAELLREVQKANQDTYRVIKALEEMAARPANDPTQSNGRKLLSGGFQHFDNPGQSLNMPWPRKEQLERLKVYDPAAAACYANHRKGRNLPMLGLGPMFIEMGAARGHQEYKDAARAQLGWKQTTDDDEQLYRKWTKGGAHGPYAVNKAIASGKVPWNEGRMFKSEDFQVQKAALNEASGAGGGYLIPPQFNSDLLTIQAEEAFFKPRCRMQPMNALTVQWPTLDITTAQATGVSPYFGGISMTWQPEASLINESEPAFRMTDWTAWTMVLYAVSSNQLLADNGIGLDALMTMLFGEAAAWFEEYAYLRGLGAGASMPLGVINSPCAINQTRGGANLFLLSDAANMLSHAQIRGWDNNIWIMHQSVIPQLIQMVGGGTIGTASTTNIPGNLLVWMNQFEEGASKKLPNAFLNGRPLFFTEKLPVLGTAGDVMLVDPSHYVIGQRLDVQIDISPHYLFRNFQLAWRVIFRSDGKFWLNNPITDSQGWTVSPAVLLR